VWHLIANNPADTQKQVPVTTPRFILASPDQAQGSGGNHQGQALAPDPCQGRLGANNGVKSGVQVRQCRDSIRIEPTYPMASHILRAYWQKRAAEVALSDSGNRRNILTLRVPFVERRPVDEFGHLATWQ
jgi:hypothetical protein